MPNLIGTGTGPAGWGLSATTLSGGRQQLSVQGGLRISFNAHERRGRSWGWVVVAMERDRNVIDRRLSGQLDVAKLWTLVDDGIDPRDVGGAAARNERVIDDTANPTPNTLVILSGRRNDDIIDIIGAGRIFLGDIRDDGIFVIPEDPQLTREWNIIPGVGDEHRKEYFGLAIVAPLIEVPMVFISDEIRSHV